MTKPFLLLRRSFWLTCLKVLCLGFVAAMLAVQIPNWLYDLGPAKPLAIDSPEELERLGLRRSTFAAVEGRPDFERAFSYRRYGLTYTYFNLEPFGMKIVVRTHRPVNEDWKELNRFLGRLRPFGAQPFSYRIRAIYADKFRVEVPEGAFFLALDEVPRLTGWKIGAAVFGLVLGLVLVYLFFFWGRRGERGRSGGVSPDPV